MKQMTRRSALLSALLHGSGVGRAFPFPNCLGGDIYTADGVGAICVQRSIEGGHPNSWLGLLARFQSSRFSNRSKQQRPCVPPAESRDGSHIRVIYSTLPLTCAIRPSAWELRTFHHHEESEGIQL